MTRRSRGIKQLSYIKRKEKQIMKNLFKYAAVQWKSMLAIIVILLVQAY